MSNHDREEGKLSTPIAIIGMSCRFPGYSNSTENLWNMLAKGQAGWTKGSEGRFEIDAHYHPATEMQGTMNTNGGHFLKEDLSRFDSKFFGISPVEAKAMDPQQRLQLETAYEAVENAGIKMEDLAGSNTSVFISTFNSDYERILSRDPENLPLYQATGCGTAFLSNRLSYFFDLNGPSVTLDTGCSSSLVALHLACQSIKNGESQLAIVGASNLILDPEFMIEMSNLKFLSDTGRCYSFDHRGNGYGRGEGVANIVLKSLHDACRDGDPIRAVIRNTIVNHDGHTTGITMPSQEAQERLIATAYERAGLSFSHTGYIEAHGTGTNVGDYIEAAAIANTLAHERSPENPIYVGSIKSNIGHLECCSGIAGVIKTVLILEKGFIPPNLNYRYPNMKISLDKLHIKIPTLLTPWPGSGLRRASVNSFGFGGTNAHAILDDAQSYLQTQGHVYHASIDFKRTSLIPHGPPLCVRPRKRLLTLSARNENSAKLMALRLKIYVSERAELDQEKLLESLCYTCFNRRSQFAYKLAIPASTIFELIAALDIMLLKPRHPIARPRIGFCFTGQGAQWYAMGRSLIESYHSFKDTLIRAEVCLRDMGAPWFLIDELLKGEDVSLVASAALGQPLCTALQIAFVDLLASWNISPTAVLGHSSGEIAAAYACGALSLEEAMQVAYFRGFCVQTARKAGVLPKAGMMAVGLSEDEIATYISCIPVSCGRVVVACVNSPTSITVSGDDTAVRKLQEILNAQDIFNRKLIVETAYHSHHMKAISGEYYEKILKINPKVNTAAIFMSSVKATTMHGSELDASYWVKNLESQVKFSQAILGLCSRNYATNDAAPTNLTISPSSSTVDILLEIGPHAALAGPIKQILKSSMVKENHIKYLASLVRSKDATECAIELAAELFTEGYPVNINSVNQINIRSKQLLLTDLPPYPWDHTTGYWHESRLSAEYRKRSIAKHHLLGIHSPDFNPLEPSWRQIIRISELPWIGEHKLFSKIVFPVAGYIAAVIEALKEQRTASEAQKSNVKYVFRDISIDKDLILTDNPDGVELKLSLGSSQEPVSGWRQFQIFSYTANQGWLRHCSGYVVLRFKEETGSIEYGGKSILETHCQMMFQEAATKCRNHLQPQQIYERLQTAGLDYGETFKNIVSTCTDASKSLSIIRIPDTAALMPGLVEMPHVIHPITLDSCFQTYCVALVGEELQSIMSPKFIESLTINDDICRKPGGELQVVTSLSSTSSFGCTADILVKDLNVADSLNSVIFVRGIYFETVPNTTKEAVPQIKQVCQKMKWALDIDHLSLNDAMGLDGDESLIKPAVHSTNILDMASDFLIRKCLDELDEGVDFDRALEHHKHLYRWMKQYASENPPQRVPSQIDLQEQINSYGPTGQMIYRLGSRLPAIIRGEAEPLSLMLEDDLISQFYVDDEHVRCYDHMRRYIDLLAHKRPDMKILEIGAGTGGATASILETLGVDKAASFSQYDFADIASWSLERAEAKFSAWASKMHFKKLNIDISPGDQGFKEGSYDLVIVANIFHATSNLNKALLHIRGLLKPSGKLLLLTTTRVALYVNIIYGTLPQWWRGINDDRKISAIGDKEEWDSLLKNAGFSGTDSFTPAYAQDKDYQYAVLLSSVALDSFPVKYRDMEIICHNEYTDAMSTLPTVLSETIGPSLCKLTTVQTSNPSGKWCIFLGELHASIIGSERESDFNFVKRMLSTATGVLWLTSGATMESTLPRASLVQGLARTVRLENEALRFVTLDLDSNRHISAKETASIIKRLFECSFHSSQSNEYTEYEYAERAGRVYIPRVIEDDAVNSCLGVTNIQSTLINVPFLRSGYTLKLQTSNVREDKSLKWVEDEMLIGFVAHDEITLEPRAASLNQCHVRKYCGRQGSVRIYGDFSGIVTNVGTNAISQFQIGDRVCGWSESDLTSSVNIKATSVQLIPDWMSFEEAASIPVTYITAYYALIYLGRIRKGESILIHGASDAVGQAAIYIAKYYESDIYITVRDEEEKEFMKEKFGILDNRIFSAHLTTFEQGLKKSTSGKGVDIVLITLSDSELEAPCKSLAPFGRLIDLVERRSAEHMFTDFRRNITYSSVDLPQLLFYSELADTFMKSIFTMLRGGVVGLISPIKTYAPSEMVTALTCMQNKKPIGISMIKIDANAQVKVLPRPSSQARLQDDASYIVVGGLGGLGRAICRWMTSLKAKNIIVISRSGLNNEPSSAFAAEMRLAGVNFAVYQSNIADAGQLAAVISRCTKEMPRIRGVIQSAMVLKDSTLDNMSHEDFQEAINPKVQGTVNLHNALSDIPLDFFIMVSSLVGIVGNSGQCSYAAGCAFQDAFAHYRRSKGLPAHSLDCGMIESAGYVSENPKIARHLLSLGWVPVKLHEFLAVLNTIITESTCSVDECQTLVGLSGSKYLSGTILRDAKFTHLQLTSHISGEAVQGSEDVNVRRALCKALTPARALDLVQNALLMKISQLLSIPVREISPSQTFVELGADSLMAVELRNWISKELDAIVQVFEITRKSPIIIFARLLVERSSLVNLKPL